MWAVSGHWKISKMLGTIKMLVSESNVSSESQRKVIQVVEASTGISRHFYVRLQGTLAEVWAVGGGQPSWGPWNVRGVERSSNIFWPVLCPGKGTDFFSTLYPTSAVGLIKSSLWLDLETCPFCMENSIFCISKQAFQSWPFQNLRTVTLYNSDLI